LAACLREGAGHLVSADAAVKRGKGSASLSRSIEGVEDSVDVAPNEVGLAFVSSRQRLGRLLCARGINLRDVDREALGRTVEGIDQRGEVAPALLG
jgi:hypothetical protein